jgi:hypothetical protein
MAKAKNTPAKVPENIPAPPSEVPAAPAPVAGVSLDENAEKWLVYIVNTNAAGQFPNIGIDLARALVGFVEINQSAPDGEGNFPAQATDAGRARVASKAAPTPAPAPDIQGSPVFAATPAAAPVAAPTIPGGPGPTPGVAQMFPAAPGGVAPVAPAAAPAASRPRLPVPEGGYAVIENIPIPAASSATRGAKSTYPFDTMAMGASFFVADSDIRKGTALSKSLSSSASSATDRSKKTGETRQFLVRRVDDGKPWGEQFAGKSGVGVWRTQVG